MTTDQKSSASPFGPQPLDAIFKPKSVAVIGATEKPGSVGRTVFWNLISSPFGGTVYPVNPNRAAILGVKAYKSLQVLPEVPDLVVICTPAPSAPALIGEAADLGIKGAVIISAGFKEIGPKGVELESQVMAQASRVGMRVVGPNCLGVMNPRTGLNATFAAGCARPGNLAFISQSGALCTAVLDWSFRENVGFSLFCSIGSMLDVGFGDLVDYVGKDPETQSIVIYMETIGNARSFLSAVREIALTKPVIVIKPGRTAGAAKAAASHTGSLTGSDDVLEAAFKRCGVIRVNEIAELFDLSEALGKQPRPKGNRLTIVTNAGGPGVLATDALLLSGGELAPVSDEIKAELSSFLPEHWSHGNPIDVLGDAEGPRYARTLEIAAKDPSSDGLLVILTPQAMTESTRTAELLAPYAHKLGKPILASWMGGPETAEGEKLLNQANIPTYPYPDTACRVFTYMYQYSKALQSLYETPALPTEKTSGAPDRAAAEKLISSVRAAGRTLLTEAESKQLLSAYQIPTVITRIAETADHAAKAADEMGYPVVVKIHSEVITHKTDVGGVKLNIQDASGVREAFAQIRASVLEKKGEFAPDGQRNMLGVTVQQMIKLDGYELILGSSIDPQFGPVILFGTGGQLVEVFKDSALALPPLNTTLARRMMEQTKIYHALHGVRGRKPVDLAALERLLVRFSHLIVEQPWIKELDMNPILASPDRIVALDARVVLHDLNTPADKLPRPAIRPYPIQYFGTWTGADNTAYVIRPLRPEDEPALVAFHKDLSEQTVYRRFLQNLPYDERVAHARLSRVCFLDYDRELALVAVVNDDTGNRKIAAVARFTKHQGSSVAEFSVIVSDSFQKKGIGTESLKRLVAAAKLEGVSKLISRAALEENAPWRRLCERVGGHWAPVDTGLGRIEINIA